MKRLLIIASLILFCSSVMAQNGDITQSKLDTKINENREVQKELKSKKKPGRFFFGFGARYSLGVNERVAVGDLSTNGTPANTKGLGGLLKVGYNVTNNWAIGVEVGLSSISNVNCTPLYANVQYFYGEKNSRWFNYVDIGAINDSTWGFYSGVGGGYRVSLTRRTKIDFTVGLDYIRMESMWYDDIYHSGDVSCSYSRLGLTFGAAFVF